ncbi:flagellar hook-associated protein 2 [Anoxybacillus sp. J5B_2022]|uniref:flagellar hook-associated protein 2 n=1 Tax=Anoxybacillus sp. J5B_2022 TaxID=3003246 RepID=UPI002286921D|nr:flagellar hook-associated protein 2 [Anoxybacillus sp. J5B_2022]MCZ0754401.1 flagellar hook-associated protein 2 [Anoxybacillus sp. J5B_2022]
MMSTMRISGLASGMDIDKLVSDLMKAERMPLDKLKQKKQILEWQRDDYRSMNTLLQDLDSYIFNNLTLQSNMLKKKTTSSDESVVTATANTSAANISTNLTVTQVATAATWVSAAASSYTPSGTDTTLKINVTNGDGTRPTNPVTITIAANSSLDAVISQLNSNSDLGITVFRDTQTGKISITKKDTGASASLMMWDATTASFFQSLGFTGVTGGAELTGKTAGKNAQFTINGLATSRSTNTFTINNVTYTLKKAGTASVTTTNDTDATFNAIKGFVDKYNEIISKINAKISEERYRDYQPLTDEQKQAMSEKQVELWEEKAKSGLLRRDSILSSGLSQMRLDVYSKVSDPSINTNYDTLSEIGITTSSNYLENGKLIINETKLRAAIENDPNSVYQLFNANGTTFDTKGIARRLRDTIKGTIGKIEQKAGKTVWTNQQFSIGRDLNQINSQIDAFNDRLKQIEDRYYRQFTAMEEAINKANSQSAYLMNAFGGGTK